MLELAVYLRFAVALFTILTPFAAIPIFLALTDGYSRRAKRKAAVTATITVATVLTVSVLSGDALLALLGTSLPSFRVGGGIVLLLMGLSMLHAQVSPVQQTGPERAEAEARDNVGVVPLGLPLLAGPGSISTVIIENQRSSDWRHTAALIAVILGVCTTVYIFLWAADPIGRRMGTIGLNIVNRLFGLLLAAIAVEIMAKGLLALFPALGG